MKRVVQQFRLGRLQVEAHPFFEWIDSERVPLEKRFIFSPVMIDFIMGFADMNKWFFHYPTPQNALERAINSHTEEDGTHSRLFYDNWYTLELDDVERWPAGQMLWWMFHSRETTTVRRFGMTILDLAVNNPDPKVRFALMEAIEICGDVFFSHTAPIAEAITRSTGARHEYYGWYHRHRETGHLHADESVFAEAELSFTQLRCAIRAAASVFDNFLRLLDDLLAYSQRAVTSPRQLAADLRSDYDAALAKPPAPGQLALHSATWDVPVASGQVELSQLLRRRVERLQRHPLMQWLREDTTRSAREKLQAFVAAWGIDIVSYKDFNELVLRYPEPGSNDERALNAWVDELASHAVLYLQDWVALDLDGVLGWNSGEVLAFYFLGAQTEPHRHHMSQVKAYAFRYKQPLVRYWLMKAQEAAGEPLFEATRAVAEAVEVSDGVVLDYWAGRHSLRHAPGGGAHELRALQCLALEPSEAERTIIREIIELVFDNMEVLYSETLRDAVSGTFLRTPGSLPPPRLSEIVLRARAEDHSQPLYDQVRRSAS